MSTNSNRSDQELLHELQQLLESYAGKIKFPLSMDSDIDEHAKIAGDDILYFLLEYGKKYEIDMSEFDFPSYFYEEGEILFNPFSWFTKGRELKKFTVGNLTDGIRLGRLDSEIVDSRHRK